MPSVMDQNHLNQNGSHPNHPRPFEHFTGNNAFRPLRWINGRRDFLSGSDELLNVPTFYRPLIVHPQSHKNLTFLSATARLLHFMIVHYPDSSSSYNAFSRECEQSSNNPSPESYSRQRASQSFPKANEHPTESTMVISPKTVKVVPADVSIPDFFCHLDCYPYPTPFRETRSSHPNF